jgi:hypothetical protein
MFSIDTFVLLLSKELLTNPVQYFTCGLIACYNRMYSKGVFEIQTDRFFKQGLVRIKERFRTKVYLFAFKRLQS